MKINISSRILLYLLFVFVGVAGVGFTFFLPSPEGFYASIIAAALAGLGVAINIYRTKQHGKQLVCPTGSNCNVVVNSRYAKFFGISLEYWGMAYYGLIVLSYSGLIALPQIFTPAMVMGVVILSILAGLFSLYLLFVQAVLLREWCIWCILSALLSLAICMFSLVSADVFIEFISQYSRFFEVIRTFGLALGVGGVTSAALLFSQSLADKSIDDAELSGIKGVFELVWVGLGLVIVGQFGLYVAYPELFAQSSAFLTQMIALGVAILSSAALMVVYAPFITYVPFEETEADEDDDSFSSLRKPILVNGAMVLVSWYFVFFSGFLTYTSLLILLTAFFSVLTIAILAALAWDLHIAQSHEEES